jgi:hypothetical protein
MRPSIRCSQEELHTGECILRIHALMSYSRVASILWNPEVHYHVSKSSPLIPCPATDQSSPHHPILFLKIHLCIILPPMSRSS